MLRDGKRPPPTAEEWELLPFLRDMDEIIPLKEKLMITASSLLSIKTVLYSIHAQQAEREVFVLAGRGVVNAISPIPLQNLDRCLCTTGEESMQSNCSVKNSAIQRGIAGVALQNGTLAVGCH